MSFFANSFNVANYHDFCLDFHDSEVDSSEFESIDPKKAVRYPKIYHSLIIRNKQFWILRDWILLRLLSPNFGNILVYQKTYLKFSTDFTT